MGPASVLRTIIVALAALSAAAQVDPVRAQTPNALSETYGDWVVRCETVQDQGRRCWMMQTLLQKPGGDRILQFELTTIESGTRAVILTPFGLAVSKGATVTVDGDGLGSFPFRTCLPSGCIIQFDPEETLIDSLRRGEKLSLGFEVAQSNEAIALELSLSGFSAAHKRLGSFTAD